MSKNDNDEIRPAAIETAPDTETNHTRSEETDLTLSVEKEWNDHISIAASAWDKEGIGVGGVAITLSESDTEDLIDQLEATLSDGGDQ